MRYVKTFWLESLTGRDHSEDLSIDGRTVLNRSLGSKVEGSGLDLCVTG
jgi:hypothetical protein